jgi:hypothetical protein
MVSLKEPMRKAVMGHKISNNQAQAEHRVLSILGKVALLGTVILFIMAIPDMIRYVKMKMM